MLNEPLYRVAVRLNSLDGRGGEKEYRQAAINHNLTVRLAEILSDGRTYQVKLGQWQEKVVNYAGSPPMPYEEGFLQIERQMVVLLVNWQDAEVGEYVAQLPISADDIPAMRFLFDDGREFERMGNYWQRIK